MLLQLQKFNLKVQYNKGKEMFQADTLSRAHLTEVNTCDFARELEAVDHTASLAMPTAQLLRIKDIASMDPVMMALRDTILRGWPPSKSGISETSLLSRKILFSRGPNWLFLPVCGER